MAAAVLVMHTAMHDKVLVVYGVVPGGGAGACRDAGLAAGGAARLTHPMPIRETHVLPGADTRPPTPILSARAELPAHQHQAPAWDWGRKPSHASEGSDG